MGIYSGHIQLLTHPTNILTFILIEILDCYVFGFKSDFANDIFISALHFDFAIEISPKIDFGYFYVLL